MERVSVIRIINNETENCKMNDGFDVWAITRVDEFLRKTKGTCWPIDAGYDGNVFFVDVVRFGWVNFKLRFWCDDRHGFIGLTKEKDCEELRKLAEMGVCAFHLDYQHGCVLGRETTITVKCERLVFPESTGTYQLMQLFNQIADSAESEVHVAIPTLRL